MIARKTLSLIAVVASACLPTFRLSPEYYIGIHGKIFEGVFPHAGKIREVELTKREWVLNGDTVNYTPSFMVKDSLAYDFGEEKKFSYKGLSEDAFIVHFASFISGIWQIHPFREGNTRTTAVFAIKYLKSKGFDVTNDLFAEKSFYFRNALVRANYENQKQNIAKTQLPLEEFFKVLVYDNDIELHNRFLKIGQEYGTAAADAIKDLHRRNDGVNVVIEPSDVVIKPSDVVINDVVKGSDVVIKFTPIEEKAIALLLQNPQLSASRLGDELGVGLRQAQRVMASLKKKAGLKRRGARKRGEWYFEKGGV